MDLKQEIERRRTFAIISHPDAGKTTLTEKLLLYGGAIQLAGSVKGKATARHAVSDWMELEKQRGISITSSVMQFEYEGYCINILDTPGHQDFSEDTYRTLMAADSAVMVIDAAKGIEPQTRKLFKICAMRHIPIFTFINKLDREARDPFELMEQLENEFGIGTYPVNWPIGCGHDFKGVFDRDRREILAFQEFHRGQNKIRPIECELTDVDRLDELIGPRQREKLTEDIELLLRPRRGARRPAQSGVLWLCADEFRRRAVSGKLPAHDDAAAAAHDGRRRGRRLPQGLRRHGLQPRRRAVHPGREARCGGHPQPAAMR